MDKKDFNILGLKINTGSSKKDIAYVTGYNSYVQKIEHICKTQKGEIPYSRSLGIEYYDLKFNSVVGKNVMQLKIQNNVKIDVIKNSTNDELLGGLRSRFIK
jgi:hypothetical protein